jgi:hypothetical protein
MDTPDDNAYAASVMSRRRLLGLMATGVAAGSAGLLLPTTSADAVTLTTYPGVDGQPTYYEPNCASVQDADSVPGCAKTSFQYNPTFHDQLGTWLEFWYLNTPSSYLKPFRVYSYGCYVNKPDDAHQFGRGFDLARIFVTENGSLRRTFTGRYDQWSTWGTDAKATARRHYWATAASAHYYFRDVLTYLWNAEHHNHIHIDNTVTGTTSSFDTGSTAQTQHVQACLNYVWGKSVTIDGDWGPETQSNSTSVLRRIGQASGTLTTKANWLAFNKATLRKGYGVEAY